MRNSEAKVLAILETVIDGIITMDDYGMIETFNPSAERIFGYAAEAVYGKNIRLLMPSPDREKQQQYVRQYLEGGKAKIIGYGREVVARHKDGGTFPIHLAINEMNLGERRHFVASVRDITQQKKIDHALRRLNETLETRVAERTEVAEKRADELARSNEALNDFTAIASHDLQEPLRKVTLFTTVSVGALQVESSPVHRGSSDGPCYQ